MAYDGACKLSREMAPPASCVQCALSSVMMHLHNRRQSFSVIEQMPCNECYMNVREEAVPFKK